MFNRYLVWLGGGVVSAGITAALIAGSGVAAADSESTSDGAATSSQTAKPSGGQADSKAATDKAGEPNTPAGPGDTPKGDTPKGDDPKGADGRKDSADPKRADGPKDRADPKHAEGPKDAEADEQDPAGGPDDKDGPVEQPEAVLDATGGSDTGERATDTMDKTADTVGTTTATVHKSAAPPDVDAEVAEVAEVPDVSEAPAVTAIAEPAPAAIDSVEPHTADLTARSAVALASAPSIAAITETARPLLRGPLIDLIGTVVFTLFSLATRLVEGPPMLPPGSTVTVHTSTLQIDCGSGYEVPVNWYFPTDPDPTRLIYLQHGFLANAPFYSYTAATLAEQTHSIVFATSLTSNFFTCDSCWLGGEPMQRAVADLFSGERTALTASASAALGEDVTLPKPVVLVGHSAGGGLVANTAGYMVENGTAGDLAGVVMLDGVSFNPASFAAALGKLPQDLQVLQIAAPPYAWNLWSETIATMADVRPGHFNGVELVDGLHIDSMQGGNPLIQFGAYLIAGFSKQQNIEAAKILAVDWINDMFAETEIYEIPGSTITIPTVAGDATAIALPAPPKPLSPLDQLLRAVTMFVLRLFVGYEPVVHTAAAPSQDSKTALIGEFSPSNAVLTLDG